MKAPNITNTVVDEANQRTYVILAPRVLTDGELYRAIRQEILRRGGKPLAQGETLTMRVTSSGDTIASAELEPQTEPPSMAVPNLLNRTSPAPALVQSLEPERVRN
jgi:hypothetical protein